MENRKGMQLIVRRRASRLLSCPSNFYDVHALQKHATHVDPRINCGAARWQSFWLGLVLAASCIALPGCGSTTAKTVSGSVTLNSQPVDGAEIIFTSQGESSQSFLGVSTSDGAYQLDLTGLDGIPAGTYQVTVTWWALKDGRPLPEGEGGQLLKTNGGAVKHTQSFTKNIVAGPNAINFGLSDKASK